MKPLARILLVVAVASLAVEWAEAQRPAFDLQKPAWRRATMLFKWEIAGVDEVERELKPLIDQALVRQDNEPVLPGLIPIVRKGMVLFRGYASADITAVYAQNVREGGKQVAAGGDTAWRSVEFSNSLRSWHKSFPRIMKRTIEDYQEVGIARVLIESEASATLIAGESLLYAVDAVPIPVPTWVLDLSENRLVRPLFRQNTLHSFDQTSGLHKWWLGQVEGLFKSQFAHNHFLGPPIMSEKHLWILAEDAIGRIQLIRIDPTKRNKNYEPEVEAPFLELLKVSADERYTVSFQRQVCPARMAFKDGILVCQTHAGSICGVDSEKNRQIWKHRYTQPAVKPRRNQKEHLLDLDAARQWQVSAWRYPAPHLAAGKLIFTAPDDPRVQCLQVKDGKPLWTAKKDGDLYLAGVFGDKVLLVGGKECRALNLTDGKEAWRLKTGVPSGKGAADGGSYYLPLRKGEKGKAEVCVIDIAAGKIARRLPTPDNEPLGNLVFHENLLISQSATVIMAFNRKR